MGATYYGGLPDKLAPTRDMVAVDTLSLPGASIIIYNNWPRVPTGTPAFIIRYCQIEARPLSSPHPSTFPPTARAAWVLGGTVGRSVPTPITSPGGCGADPGPRRRAGILRSMRLPASSGRQRACALEGGRVGGGRPAVPIGFCIMSCV